MRKRIKWTVKETVLIRQLKIQIMIGLYKVPVSKLSIYIISSKYNYHD